MGLLETFGAWDRALIDQRAGFTRLGLNRKPRGLSATTFRLSRNALIEDRKGLIILRKASIEARKGLNVVRKASI